MSMGLQEVKNGNPKHGKIPLGNILRRSIPGLNRPKHLTTEIYEFPFDKGVRETFRWYEAKLGERGYSISEHERSARSYDLTIGLRSLISRDADPEPTAKPIPVLQPNPASESGAAVEADAPAESAPLPESEPAPSNRAAKKAKAYVERILTQIEENHTTLRDTLYRLRVCQDRLEKEGGKPSGTKLKNHFSRYEL